MKIKSFRVINKVDANSIAPPIKTENGRGISYEYWLSQLALVNKDQKIRFIYDSLRYKEHLHIFGRYFFPHIIKGKDNVPECHIDLLEELSSDRDSAIIFPRGFAKSTWEKIDTIHDVVYGLEKVILYIANTIGDAQNHFESIKGELENNETLIAIYGFLVPPDFKLSHKWTNKHFETTNGINVVARGAGKGRGVNIKNNRPSKIIFDDVEEDEQVRSVERRLKLHNWINNVIFPSRDNSKSKIKMIGTVISPLAEVLAFYKGHGGIFRCAIEDGRSIWPSYMPLSKLNAIRDGYDDTETGKHIDGIGTRAFMQEFQNNPTDPSLALIVMEWLEPHFYTTIAKESDMQIYIMFDPQAGESKGSDYYGLCVLGRFPGDKHRYILQLQTGRASQIDQAAIVVRTYQQYNKHNVRAIGVEKVMTQVAVYQLILDWQSGKINLPGVNNDNRNIGILAVEPQGKDKVARMEMFQPAFERGEIHLHTTMRAFAEKLTCFPNVEHDDECLVGETLILTRRGDVPIRDVLVGDEVMTRKGWKKVLISKSTGLKKVITRLGITGTPNHPVITTTKRKPLQYINVSDRLYVWNEKLSYIEEKNITATQIQNGDIYESIFGGMITGRSHLFRCIDRYILIISEKFRKVGMSITKTTTLLTTLLQTLRLFPQKIMPVSIKTTPMVIGKDGRKAPDLRLLTNNQECAQKNGMVRKKVFNGIKNTQKHLYGNWIKRNISWFADTVQKSLSLITHGLRFVAHGHVKISSTLTTCERVVYNLRVEDANEFVANGILVHNCDALMYCLEYANRGSSLNFAQLREKYPSPPGITAGLRQRIF